MTLCISKKVPGQPWVIISGSGFGPLPFSWMKCTCRPSTGALKCEKLLMSASCLRQSKSFFQYSTSSLM